MRERQSADHVPIEEITLYMEGKLSDVRSRALREHFDRCARCRLEAKRLERFMRIESDDDLAREAEWLYARGKLEKIYRERIAPPAVRRADRGDRRAIAWLMPVAAVAAAVLLVVRFAAREERPIPPGAGDVLRGAPPVQYEITLREPIGEIEGAPSLFAWESARPADSYTLEIFSPSLERVYAASNVAGGSFTVPDSLRRILKPNIVYLWSVTGTAGLERPSGSPNGWFTYRR